MSSRHAVVLSLLLAAVTSACASAQAWNEEEEQNEAALSEEASAEYNAFAAVVRGAGGKLHPGGTATVLGIRGLDKRTMATHDTRSAKAFDDLVVVLEKNGKVHRLAASTHPWETRGVPGVPDVDRDGMSDVGMIRPGLYLAKGRGADRGRVGGLPAFDVSAAPSGSGLLPGWRDVNHDGVFDDEERTRSETRRDTLSAVLFHRGGDGAPAAVGCQVFDAAEMNELIAAVGGPSASFNYVLVDARTIDVDALPR